MTAGFVALTLVAGGLMATELAAPKVPYRQKVEKWRAKHEADYRREYVGLAGLFSLKPGQNAAGSAKSNPIVLPPAAPPVVGRFVLNGERVRFEPERGAKITLKDTPLQGPIDLKKDEDK